MPGSRRIRRLPIPAGIAVAVVFLLIGGLTGGLIGGPAGPARASAAPSPVLVWDCLVDRPGVVKPTTIPLACGDGSVVAGELHWTHWGTTSASAQGVVNVVSCVPSCADGQDVAYPARVVLSRTVRTPAGFQYFTLVTVTYRKAAPAGVRKLRNGTRVGTYQDCTAATHIPYIPRCPRRK